MASTYSTDYQIALMTTGTEAGSWGGITNDNLEKVGNSVGGSVVVNVTTPPTGGSWDGGTYVMNWVTENTSAKGTSGTSPVGSGRARFVVFADSGAMGDDITVNICGNTSSDKPERVFFAKNSLSASRSITFKLAGSGSYVLANGKTALLFTNSVAKGTGDEIAADTVANILDALQVTSLTLQNGETISNAVDGTVAIDGATLKVGTGAATATVRSSGPWDLELLAGDSDFAKIVVADAVNGSISLEPDGAGVVSVVGTLDVTGAGGIILSNDETITNAVDGTIVLSGAVTSTGAVQGTSLKDGTMTISSGNMTAVGTIGSGAITSTSSITSTSLDATAGTIETTGAVNGGTVTATTIATAADVSITGTDGYIAFDTIEATPADGYGIRDLAGKVQVKSNGGNWGGIYSANQASGDGTYFKSAAQTSDAADNASIAHGLGAVPRIVRCTLQCTSTDAGYAVGDVVQVGGEANTAGHRGICFGSNSTYVFYVIGSGGWLILNKTDGSSDVIVPAKWDIYLEAWL